MHFLMDFDVRLAYIWSHSEAMFLQFIPFKNKSSTSVVLVDIAFVWVCFGVASRIYFSCCRSDGTDVSTLTIRDA